MNINMNKKKMYSQKPSRMTQVNIVAAVKILSYLQNLQ